jgi:hypothetical protein
MSLVIFLFVTTLFLFFLGSYALSPEHNPKVKEIMEDAKRTQEGKRVKGKHTFSEGDIKITAAVLNGIAILFSAGLIFWIPFFRVIAAVSMAVYVVRFFYRRFFRGPENFAWCDQDPKPERRVGNHSESADQQPHRPRGPGHP